MCFECVLLCVRADPLETFPMSLSDHTRRTQGLRIVASTLLLGVPFGVLAGAFLCAVAYYRIVADDLGGILVFALLAAIAFLVAGFFAARRATSATAGALAAFLSGLLAAAAGTVMEQRLAPADLDLALLIAAPLGALVLGILAGFVGATGGARERLGAASGDDTIAVHPPLIPSHRTWRAQGTDYPQGDDPSF
jgi:hypothetical protein